MKQLAITCRHFTTIWWYRAQLFTEDTGCLHSSYSKALFSEFQSIRSRTLKRSWPLTITEGRKWIRRRRWAASAPGAKRISHTYTLCSKTRSHGKTTRWRVFSCKSSWALSHLKIKETKRWWTMPYSWKPSYNQKIVNVVSGVQRTKAHANRPEAVPSLI